MNDRIFCLFFGLKIKKNSKNSSFKAISKSQADGFSHFFFELRIKLA